MAASEIAPPAYFTWDDAFFFERDFLAHASREEKSGL